MMRDSHTPIQVDIPGAKCLPPGLSLKNIIFGSNTGYEVRAVSYFLIVYCKKKKKKEEEEEEEEEEEFIVFPYGIVLAQLFLYFSARFWRPRETRKIFVEHARHVARIHLRT